MRPRRTFLRTKTVPALVLVLSIVAVGAITLLQRGAGAGRDAQLSLANLKSALMELQNARFQASARTGGSPALARKLIRGGKQEVAGTLADLRRRATVTELDEVETLLCANYAALDAIGASGADYGTVSVVESAGPPASVW
jgi:hypothetical protein